MNIFKKFTKIESGFTFLEVIVACVAMGIVITVITTAFISIQRVNYRTKNLAIGTQVVQQQVELYRNTPYSSIPIGTQDISSQLAVYPSLGQPRSASITVTEVSADILKKIDVALIYTENGVTKNIQTSTLVAARGINK